MITVGKLQYSSNGDRTEHLQIVLSFYGPNTERTCVKMEEKTRIQNLACRLNCQEIWQ